MRNTGTHASRPTAGSIWSSFRSSGKRHIIITGGRGTGKSTLLRALFPEHGPGLTTWAEPRKAVYLRDNTIGETAMAGEFDQNLPGPENRMRPVNGGFDGFGIEILRRCAAAEGDWVTIDEVGYLECGCDEYCGSLLKLLEKKHVAAVVRKQELPFIEQLTARRDVFRVDLDAPFGNIGCVIMASGLGKRFGGNKLTAEFAGKPLIQWVLEAVSGIFARVAVITRSHETAVVCQNAGFEVTLHELPFRSDTVRLGTECMKDMDGCVFCQADQPLISQYTLMAMALAALNGKEHIWRAAYDGVPGAPVLFPSRLFGELMTLPEGKGGGAVAARHEGDIKLIEAASPCELRDIDTRYDLAELEEYLMRMNK